MSKIVRKNDQSNPLRKVGEYLYRNGHGVYFAWFAVRGKQIKRSLKALLSTTHPPHQMQSQNIAENCGFPICNLRLPTPTSSCAHDFIGVAN
jgi:hypothetical protein